MPELLLALRWAAFHSAVDRWYEAACEVDSLVSVQTELDRGIASARNKARSQAVTARLLSPCASRPLAIEHG